MAPYLKEVRDLSSVGHFNILRYILIQDPSKTKNNIVILNFSDHRWAVQKAMCKIRSIRSGSSQ